jgi:hypothetical protein
MELVNTESIWEWTDDTKTKNIVMTRDNTKWTSASEVNLLVYRDDGWTTVETYVG